MLLRDDRRVVRLALLFVGFGSLVLLSLVASMALAQDGGGLAPCPGPDSVGVGTELPPQPDEVSLGYLVDCGHCVTGSGLIVPTSSFATPTAEAEDWQKSCYDPIQVGRLPGSGEYVWIPSTHDLVVGVEFALHWMTPWEGEDPTTVVVNALDAGTTATNQHWVPFGPGHPNHGMELVNHQDYCFCTSGYCDQCSEGTWQFPLGPGANDQVLDLTEAGLYLSFDFESTDQDVTSLWVDRLHLNYFGVPDVYCGVGSGSSGGSGDDDATPEGDDIIRTCIGGATRYDWTAGDSQDYGVYDDEGFTSDRDYLAWVFLPVFNSGGSSPTVYFSEGEPDYIDYYGGAAQTGIDIFPGSTFCVGAAEACSHPEHGSPKPYIFVEAEINEQRPYDKGFDFFDAGGDGFMLLASQFGIFYGEDDGSLCHSETGGGDEPTPTPADTPTPIYTPLPGSQWWYGDRFEITYTGVTDGSCDANFHELLSDYDGQILNCNIPQLPGGADPNANVITITGYFDAQVVGSVGPGWRQVASDPDGSLAGWEVVHIRGGGQTCSSGDSRLIRPPLQVRDKWPSLGIYDCVHNRNMEYWQYLIWADGDGARLVQIDAVGVYGYGSELLPTSTPTMTPTIVPTNEFEPTASPTGFLTPVPTDVPEYDCSIPDWSSNEPVIDGFDDIGDIVTDGICLYLIPEFTITTTSIPTWMQDILGYIGFPDFTFHFDGFILCPDWVDIPSFSLFGVEISSAWFLLVALAFWVRSVANMN